MREQPATSWAIYDWTRDCVAIYVAPTKGQALRMFCGPDVMQEWPAMKAAGWTATGLPSPR